MSAVFIAERNVRVLVDERPPRRVEATFSGPLQILTPEEAKRLGRALIKAGKFAEKTLPPRGP